MADHIKQKRLRFTYQDDVAFLKEFLAHNPMENVTNWNIIQENFEKTSKKRFAIKTLKNHLRLLVEAWLAKEDTDKTLSGVEETYCERDVLLQEIHTLFRETEYTPQKKKKLISKEKQLCILGQQSRDNFALQFPQQRESPERGYFDIGEDIEVDIAHEIGISSEVVMESPCLEDPKYEATMDEPSTSRPILKPQRRKNNKLRPLRKGALDYLTAKHANELQIKARELDLQERRLLLDERKHALEQEKFELDRVERQHKIEMEKKRFQLQLEEKNTTNQLLQSQQKIIDALINKK